MFTYRVTPNFKLAPPPLGTRTARACHQSDRVQERGSAAAGRGVRSCKESGMSRFSPGGKDEVKFLRDPYLTRDCTGTAMTMSDNVIAPVPSGMDRTYSS